jgi:hypothetical protein
MHTSAKFSPAEAVTRPRDEGPSLGRLAKALATRISAWATARADRIGAELLYQELSKLSDAELRQRGLSRATLARDVCEAVAERKVR